MCVGKQVETVPNSGVKKSTEKKKYYSRHPYKLFCFHPKRMKKLKTRGRLIPS